MNNKKKIVIAISSSIAIYKILDLVSQLKKDGHSVYCILTENATKLVSTRTFEAISGNAVYSDLWEAETKIPHIELVDNADLFILAPATYNVIGKIANGIADDLVTTCAAVCHCRKLIAPAMNVHMYENPILQRNLNLLRLAGWEEIPPSKGMLACGYEGIGKLTHIDNILEAIRTDLTKIEPILKGKRVLVTAGGSIEDIDPVRYITNRSSGKMGLSICKVAFQMSARVTLVHSKVEVEIPDYITSIKVRSAKQMLSVLEHEIEHHDILIMAAAVADFTPSYTYEQKIKKDKNNLILDLEKTDDILENLKSKKANKYFIGFAAESENLLENAQAKLYKKELDMIVANNIKNENSGFESDTNKVFIIQKDREPEEFPLMSKDEVAKEIFIRYNNSIVK